VFSPLDGYGKLEDYALRAKALGFEGLCISDHGNMIAHIKQRDICKKHGIKPIYANEGYFTLHDGNIKEKIEGYKSAYHILLIAMNDVGYANLRKATSIAWTKYKYYKPRFDMALLEECSEGIICTSACLGGAISQLFLSDRAEEAEEVALRLNRIFPGRFYLELTYTGLEEQHLANNFLREFSAKHNIPLIITNFICASDSYLYT
jgi:DNA polymerase-3 subunit alpha